MDSRFSRIGLFGWHEDARVADSMSAFAGHLLRRGLTVLADPGAAASCLPAGVSPVVSTDLANQADLIVAIGGDGRCSMRRSW